MRFGGLEKDMQGMDERLSRRIDALGDKISVALKAQASFLGAYGRSVADSERNRISNKFAHLPGVKRTDAKAVHRSVLKTSTPTYAKSLFNSCFRHDLIKYNKCQTNISL